MSDEAAVTRTAVSVGSVVFAFGTVVRGAAFAADIEPFATTAASSDMCWSSPVASLSKSGDPLSSRKLSFRIRRGG
jgi:hypothetical protein